jgi:hypothetical protein
MNEHPRKECHTNSGVVRKAHAVSVKENHVRKSIATINEVRSIHPIEPYSIGEGMNAGMTLRLGLPMHRWFDDGHPTARSDERQGGISYKKGGVHP